MIVQFSDHSYINIDSITLLKQHQKPKKGEYGFVIAGSGCAYLNKRDYLVIEKAFCWMHGHTMYNKELKKGVKVP